MEPAGRASEPAGRASEPASRASELSGRDLKPAGGGDGNENEKNENEKNENGEKNPMSRIGHRRIRGRCPQKGKK